MLKTTHMIFARIVKRNNAKPAVACDRFIHYHDPHGKEVALKILPRVYDRETPVEYWIRKDC
jgi:hypothetical protein